MNILAKKPGDPDSAAASLREPQDIWRVFYLINSVAREEGEVTFITTGRDAGEAIRVVAALLEGETPTLAEATRGLLEQPYDMAAEFGRVRDLVRRNLKEGRPPLEGMWT